MLRVGVCCVFAVEGFSAVMIGSIKMLRDDSPAVNQADRAEVHRGLAYPFSVTFEWVFLLCEA